DHLFHEQAAEHRSHQAGICEQDCPQSCRRGEKDDAIAAIGGHHEEHQRPENNEEAHCAVQPPSIVIACPVTFRASGLIRYSTAPAISSKVMKAFFGIGASITRSITSSS